MTFSPFLDRASSFAGALAGLALSAAVWAAILLCPVAAKSPITSYDEDDDALDDDESARVFSDADKELRKKKAYALAKTIVAQKRRIRLMECKHKLHDVCRACNLSHCPRSESNKASKCRHWASARYDGKTVRVMHHFDRDEDIADVINKAIALLNQQIEAKYKEIWKMEAQIRALGFSYESDFKEELEAKLPPLPEDL